MTEDDAVHHPEAELLPWLLNGTLERGEAQHVREHLVSCASCRHELGETRWAAAVFGAHLPAAAVVAIAWDAPPDGVDAELARQHLARCAACAEELALARQSRRLAADERPAAAPFLSRYAGLAAALLVGLGAGLLAMRLGGRATEQEARRLDGRVGELEEQVRRLRESPGPAVPVGPPAPMPNLPIVELSPDSAVRGSGPPRATSVTVSASAPFVALVLGSDRARGDAEVDLRDPHGAVVWKGRGLRRGALGGYTLGLPAALLSGDAYVLVLRPSRGAEETYAIRVEHAP